MTTPTIDSESNTAVVLPKIYIKARRALPFFGRHPWVFAGAIQRVEGDPQPGAVVDVVTNKGEHIARGLFNPASNIRVRLYSWDPEVALDDAFWIKRIDDALALRATLGLLNAPESAARLIYSEADGLSGLIVDRYGKFLLVQLTSLALSQRQDVLIRHLYQKLQPLGIHLRTEKGIREAEGLEITDGLLKGTDPPRPLFIEENGIRYGVDVTQGQKTGFFIDQRDNRAAVARYTRGHRVLDLFCYTGGFGLNAIMNGGAKRVLSVDASSSAINTAKANAELNSVADHFRFEVGDAFQVLERLKADGEKFDTVILDPPKMARHRGGVTKALRGYFSLNRLALDIIAPGGILVSCSCSGHVDHALFTEMLSKVAIEADRPIQILESRGQAADHPTSVHCLETNYLKCFICRVV